MKLYKFLLPIAFGLPLVSCTEEELDPTIFQTDPKPVDPNGYTYKFEVDGLFYTIIDPTAKEVEVTSGSYGSYSGDIVVPASVSYNGEQYTVASIGYEAFLECHSLTSITLPNSVVTIGTRAFSECSSLASISLPDSVTTIGNSAFDECRSLTAVTLPDSLTTIEDDLFSYCRNLTSVTFPNTLTTIGTRAFAGCINLTAIALPDSVATIGGWAFSGCCSLASITLPCSVTTIGDSAFSWCRSLTSITSHAVTPPECGYSIFYDINTDKCTLYVPSESMEAYKQAKEWKDFMTIVAASARGGAGFEG